MSEYNSGFCFLYVSGQKSPRNIKACAVATWSDQIFNLLRASNGSIIFEKA